MTRQQKKDQAWEVMQSAPRPPTGQQDRGQPGDLAEEQGAGSVVALRWPDRARQAETAVDDERRHRREQAVPQRKQRAEGWETARRNSLLLIRGEEPHAGPGPGHSGEAG